MVEKQVLAPHRVRTIPHGFSWIDRRFVRDGFIRRLTDDDLLLYFFLVSVADARGLSYWSDPVVSNLLHRDAPSLSRARDRLVQADLLAYDFPLYQVLSLPEARPHA